MNQINSANIHSLPFKYKEFIAKKEKGLDSIVFRIKQTATFNKFLPLRDQPVSIFDSLIVGSNMLLNLLILEKITKNIGKKEINVGIYLPKELDYWSYNIIGTEELLTKLKNIEDFSNCVKIEDVFDVIIRKLKGRNFNLLLLDDRYRINYVEYDNNTQCSFFWFDNQKNKIVKNEYFIEQNNKIKNFINDKIIKMFTNSLDLSKLSWNFKKTFQKNEEEQNVALAISKATYLSSLPQGWMTLNNDVQKDKVCFKSELDNKYYLYGTSKVIFFEQNNMIKNCIQEVITLATASIEKY